MNNTEQHNHTFSNFVLHGKLCKAVIKKKQETRRVFLPEELSTDKTDVIEETIQMVLKKKIRMTPPPLFYIGGEKRNTHLGSSGYYRVCGQIGCALTFEEIGSQKNGPGGST